MQGAHCITIAGGKGGCGKTTTAVNTAYALDDAGFDVVVVDTDLAMPNLHTVLGTSHEPTIHDVLADVEPLEAAIDTSDDVAAVYGDPSLDRYTDADPAELQTVCNRLRTAFDVVVLDTGAGVTHATMVPCGLADDVVLDIGTGTGAIAFGVADDAARVLGRDISEGMLDRAREKAAERGIETIEFGEGRFRDPQVSDDTAVDIVTSNFATHHLADVEKREAVDGMAGFEPRRIVLGDVMFFGDPDPEEPFYSPEVDDPATVGVLADAFTDSGYALMAVEMIDTQVGVLVAERTTRT